MRSMLKQTLPLLFCGSVFAASPALAANVVDYGDPNAPRLWRQLAALERHESREVVRILQLGDSHTAGDYFTQAYRSRLQQRFGNSGPGWITPGYVKNQRSAQFLMKMSGDWNMRISRGNPENLPVGGIGNLPAPGAQAELVPKFPLNGMYKVSVWSRKVNDLPVSPWKLTLPNGEVRELSPPISSDWQMSYVLGNGNELNSFFLKAQDNPAELGGIAIDALNPGVTVDALGIVGAMQRVTLRWQQEAVSDQLRWRQPDLIVLAYGTNEAFDPKPDWDAYYQDLKNSIRLLRQKAPSAAILMIGAPDSARRTGPGDYVGCRFRQPTGLNNVKTIQKQVAVEEKILFWDWMAAMGGTCAIQRYASATPPLAGQDLIHFTQDGYEMNGEAFYEALMQAYQRGRQGKG